MTDTALADHPETQEAEAPRLPEGPPEPDPKTDLWPRVLGHVRGAEGSPTLICIGGVHGNEPAGVLGLCRIFAALGRDPSGIRGTFVGLVGNRKALRAHRRYLRHDLNRHWLADRVERLRAHEGPLHDEDEELRELVRELDGVLREATGTVFGVDLHTTSGQGPAFAVLDDLLPNRRFADALPVTLVVGIEEELEGTVPDYLISRGVRIYGFESGQHDDPFSVDLAEAAVWVALESSGVLEADSRPEVEAARKQLAAANRGLPHVVEVRHRHHVTPEAGFEMLPGFVNFQPVTAGTPMARDRHGAVLAPESGLVLMPLYQAQGEDGFFIVRRLRPIWLKISAVVRRAHVERWIHLLPGVRRHPELPHTFIADRRWARWGALELFHLLGYRRTGLVGRYLTMTRRRDDD
ncbi:MAG: succinylglutamate desuccinylase/aspartoacylase family protein [Acidobacteriota bacterium]